MTDAKSDAAPSPKLAAWKPPAPTATPAGTDRSFPPKAAAPAAPAAPGLTNETLLQRLRYFENLVDLQHAHIKTLITAVNRTGTAAPTTPHFPVLRGAAGAFDPNDR